jgi:hypothetical protein
MPMIAITTSNSMRWPVRAGTGQWDFVAGGSLSADSPRCRVAHGPISPVTRGGVRAVHPRVVGHRRDSPGARLCAQHQPQPEPNLG